MHDKLKNKILCKFIENKENNVEYTEDENENIHIKTKVAGLFNYELLFKNYPIHQERVCFRGNGEPYYSIEESKNYTAKAIAYTYITSQEHLIADIMIASAICEVLNNEVLSKYFKANNDTAKLNLEQMKQLAAKAISELTENDYDTPYEVLNKKCSAVYKQRYVFDGVTTAGQVAEWVSNKILNEDDFCDFIFHMFRWYTTDKNCINISSTNAQHYNLAKIKQVCQ